jgi:hypothetical protein
MVLMHLECCCSDTSSTLATFLQSVSSVPSQHGLLSLHAAGADSGSSHAPALAYAEQLACVLIANLGDGGLRAKTSTEGTQVPTVAALADSLLGSLLAAFPALYHSHACYAALLAQLQEEEGDAPMGQVGSCQLL